MVLIPLGSPSLTSTNKYVSPCHVGETHVVTRATLRVNVFLTHLLAVTHSHTYSIDGADRLRDPYEYFDRFPQADVLTSSDNLEMTTTDGGLEIFPDAGAAANIGIMHFNHRARELGFEVRVCFCSCVRTRRDRMRDALPLSVLSSSTHSHTLWLSVSLSRARRIAPHGV